MFTETDWGLNHSTKKGGDKGTGSDRHWASRGPEKLQLPLCMEAFKMLLPWVPPPTDDMNRGQTASWHTEGSTVL